jgi:hypothetical protein
MSVSCQRNIYMHPKCSVLLVHSHWMCNLYKSNYPLTPDGHHKLIRWRLVTHCAIDGYSRMVVYGGICTVVLDSVPEYYGIEELPLTPDGHHKLIRWRLVTHCAIDGYSRMVVFIKCSSNNRSNTVYESFLQAVQRYGLPSRIHCDQGTENILVCQHMLHHRGTEKRSVLVGSSAHASNVYGGICTVVLQEHFMVLQSMTGRVLRSHQAVLFSVMLSCISFRTVLIL